MHDLNEKTRKEFLLETARAEELRERIRSAEEKKLSAGYLVAFNIMLVILAGALLLNL
jgi:hypothetical protein